MLIVTPLQVLLFTDADVFAGTERHMLDLALGLRDRGIAPTLACPHPAPLATHAEKALLPTIAIAKRGLVDWQAVRILCGLLKSKRIDLIHAHNGRTHLSAALAVVLARRGRCVLTQHFIEPGHTQQHGFKAKIFGLVHHWVNAHTARFIAISQAVNAAMLSRNDAPPGRIQVIWNGISDPQTATLSSRESIRERFGIPSHAPLVVCAARLEAEKDIATLVEAFSQIRDVFPQVHCLVAGEGSLRPQLERQIHELGLAARLQLPGFLPDVLAVIQACDVFVLPSLNEPFGLVLLEAMALEKPVIATSSGGALEIVAEGQTGTLVPAQSPRDMAGALRWMLENPSLSSAMGRAGRQRFEQHFTREIMAQHTHEAYCAALGGNTG